MDTAIINTNVTNPGLTQLADTSPTKRLLTQSPVTNKAGSVSFSQLLQQREQGQDVATAAMKSGQQQDAQRSEAAKRRHEAENRENKAGLSQANTQGAAANVSSRAAQGSASSTGNQGAGVAAEEEHRMFGDAFNASTTFSRATRLSTVTIPSADKNKDSGVAEHLSADAAAKGSGQRLVKTNLRTNDAGKSGRSLNELVVKPNQSDLMANKIDGQSAEQEQQDTRSGAEAEVNLTMSAVAAKDNLVAKDSSGSSYTATPPNTEPYFMQSRLDGGGWHTEMSQRIVWMCQGEHQSAVLTLNPPNLGPLKIEIQAHRNVITANFVSDNPEVRQALADGFPALKSAMSNAGVVLDRATVLGNSDASETGQSSTPNQLIAKRFVSNHALPKANPDSDQPGGSLDHGLVDTFA